MEANKQKEDQEIKELEEKRKFFLEKLHLLEKEINEIFPDFSLSIYCDCDCCGCYFDSIFDRFKYHANRIIKNKENSQNQYQLKYFKKKYKPKSMCTSDDIGEMRRLYFQEKGEIK